MTIRIAIAGMGAALSLAACGEGGDTALIDTAAAQGGSSPPPGFMQASAVTMDPQGPAATGAMQAAEIVDAQGFGQPMRAATLQVPAGWRAEGGIDWDRSTPCVGNQMKIQWRASAPDGSRAFELMPGFAWQLPEGAVQMNPCPVAGVRSAREFLMAAAQNMRPGARIVQYRDKPELANGAQQGAGQRHDGGELTIAYAGPAGEVNEALSALVTFTTMGSSVMGTTAYVAAMRGPAGKLDPALGYRIQRSLKPDQQYFATVRQSSGQMVENYSNRQRQDIQNWHSRRMADINAKGAADRAAIRSQTSRDVAAINARTHANTVATNDGIHDRTIQGIREESTWMNPYTGSSYQGSIHGPDRVIGMDDGTIVRTDDPYYNPGGTEYEPQP